MKLDSAQRNRLVRLALLCNAEQIIDRSQLQRILDIQQDDASSAAQTEAIVREVFTASRLGELNEHLLTHNKEIAALNSELYGTSTTPLAVVDTPTASGDFFEATFAEEEEPVLMSSDLQVSVWPRLLVPLAVVALLVLGGFVYSAVQTVLDEYWGDELSRANSTLEIQSSSEVVGYRPTNPGGEEVNLNEEGQLFGDPQEELPTGVASVSAKLNLNESVQNLAENGQWEQAILFLNSAEQDQRDASTRLWEAGLLVGSDAVAAADEALHLLVSPEVLDVENEMWRDVFAVALMRASDPARTKAAKALLESSERARTKRSVLRLLDWAAARNGESELSELRSRSADFKATAVDHIFLAYADFFAGKTSQAAYHTAKAMRRFEVEQPTDELQPEWLYELCRTRIRRTICRMEKQASAIN